MSLQDAFLAAGIFYFVIAGPAALRALVAR